MESGDSPRESGGAESAHGAAQRISLRVRLMRKFSVAIGRKKKDGHRSTPSSPPLTERRTIPLMPAAVDSRESASQTPSDTHELENGEVQELLPKPIENENVISDTGAFATNDASADEAPPKPPKPKPRGSILSRMRRASRTAVDFGGVASPKATPDQTEDDRGEHPKQGGLNAFKKALSGRKLGLTAAAASATGGDKEEPDKVVQKGTVKSLISQTNTKAAANSGKPTGLVEKAKSMTPSKPESTTPAKPDLRTASSTTSKPAQKVEDVVSTSARSAGSSAHKVKFDDSARLSDAKKGPVNRQATSSPSTEEKDNGSNNRPLSVTLKKKHSIDEKRQSRKSVSKYRSAAEGGLELSSHEQAFMPGDLLKRLGQSAGQLPPAPSVFPGQGAVLFVDVSGFTRLAERLNKENVPVTASQKLAATITRVLEVLAQVCLDCGGEVGKFAGDALLCVWESNDLNKAEILAKHCAVEMLIEMENLNRIEKVDLQIHGGVAKGSIVHFHFGSSDDDLRWYLISGEAVAAATTLVDVANAGEFCCQEGIAKGLPSILDENDVSPRPDGRKGFKISKDVDSGNMFSSFRGISMPKAKAAIKDDDAPRHTKSLARGKKEVPTTFLTSTAELPARPNFPPEHSNISSVLKDGLPRSCNVYIPSALRDQLNERSEKKGEMRRRVAAMFVEIGTLVMTEDELLKQTVSDSKLDSLNSAFVTMTRIVHAFEGEVRDMLFDDKGCVYIAIFGAHCEEEKEHHPWNMLAVKAGMAIVNEVPSARIGVSIGTCFVGMAGVIERRTDFVVVGHEVNMSARYMSNARPGQVLVSSGIYSSTKEEIKYGPEIQIMVGKGEYAKQRSVYSPMEESHRRASFQASYRRSMGGGGLFIGRTQEIQAIETNMNKISNGRSGVMVIEAPPGRGKSSIVSRAKRMGRGKIKIVSGQALSTERNTPYFTFRQVLEAYTGIRPSMTASEARTIIEMIEAGKGEKINIMALALAMPWISESSEHRSKANGTSSKDSITPDRVADTFLQIIRLNFDRSNEKSALIVLEDVHWMDKESLEMLMRLIDGLEKLQKVAILLTFRADEPEKTVNVFEAMEFAAYGDDPEAKAKELQRKELIINLKSKARKLKFNSLWIDLPPLPKPDATKFAEKLLGGELNELSAQKVWDQAKGDPFYLELLAQWLVEKNMVRQEKAGTIHVACDPSAFPKTSDELIQNRMSKLTEDQRRVLQLAASGGEVFDAVYVSAVSKALATAESRPGDAFSTDTVMAGLNAASDIELVTFITDSVKRDEAQQRWKFKHDLIYRAIWVQILTPRRNVLDRIAATDRKKLALRLKSSFFENTV